jgi:signal transduction histidine kinase
VDAVVLRRPDYRTLRATVAHTAQDADDVHGLLSATSQLLAPALSAAFVTWREWTATEQNGVLNSTLISGADDVATIARSLGGERLPGLPSIAATIPTADAPQFVFVVGQLTEGRRLLSDDLSTLEAIAVTVARRIDALRISNERYHRELREQEMGKLATEAELRALRAQINPHFLFNALTTIGYLIQTAPPRALETLLRLTALLRGVLRSEGEFTTLGRELEIVAAYLDIERARFEHRLRVTIDAAPRLTTIRLPALVLQPVVENAVKHGIANKQSGGDVVIRARVETLDGHPDTLSITVQDTGAGASPEAVERGRRAGVGLRNIERRLQCQYGPAASLTLQTAPDEGTTVEIRVPVALTAGREPEVHRAAS